MHSKKYIVSDLRSQESPCRNASLWPRPLLLMAQRYPSPFCVKQTRMTTLQPWSMPMEAQNVDTVPKMCTRGAHLVMPMLFAFIATFYALSRLIMSHLITSCTYHIFIVFCSFKRMSHMSHMSICLLSSLARVLPTLSQQVSEFLCCQTTMPLLELHGWNVVASMSRRLECKELDLYKDLFK